MIRNVISKSALFMLLRKPYLCRIQTFNFSQNHKKPQEKKKIDIQEEDPSYYNKYTSIYVFVVSIILLGFGYLLVQFNRIKQNKQVSGTHIKTMYSTGKARIGGSWQLYDTDGNIVSNKTLQGQYYLMYFGFCNCPDICPNLLQKMSKALKILKKMPQMRNIQIQAFFISVDPDRDSNQKLKKYLSHFNSNIIGLSAKSNDDPKLKECLSCFKVYTSKIGGQNQNSSQYMIDHTVFIFLMDTQSKYLGHISPNQNQFDFAQYVSQNIIQAERQKGLQMKLV